MNCKYFGICGSCNFYDTNYEDALNIKLNRLKELLRDSFNGNIEVFSSPKANHRARAEFKIWHIKDRCYYAMSNINKDGIAILDECPKVIKPIEDIQNGLLEFINRSEILKHKLFSIEFLAGLSGDVLVTLIYHKKLDDSWQEEARSLQNKFKISIIGRAKKQKIVLNKEYILEELVINGTKYSYKYYEGGFTQPNPYINKNMIEWAINNIKDNGKDFLEAYCGLGNFTIPISRHFRRVLATEVSKNSIKAAKENCTLNGIENTQFIRLNAKETAEALSKVREFRRLKDINLDEYEFSTILVDPPRAGLDEDTINLAKSIDNIVYISCNPETLALNLKELTKTHKVTKVALFDQFPYTHHIESGVILKRV